METGGVAAIVVAILGAGGLGAWLQHVLAYRRTAARDKVKDEQYLIEEHAKRIRRHEAVEREMRRAVELLAERHALCREDTVELQGIVRFLYGLLGQSYAAIKKLGGDPGPMPELPPMRDRHSAADAEFLKRTVEHNAELTKAVDDEVAGGGGR